MNIMCYPKLSPLTGLAGFGGGATSLSVHKGASGTGKWFGTRGIFAGGRKYDGSWSYSNIIDYVTIGSAGNATDFGDITNNRAYGAGAADGTRGLFLGGYTASGNSNTIDYITIASTGNATDFGDLTAARDQGGGACDGNFAYYAGGNPGAFTAVIDYVTVMTPGNGSDFGDLTVARYLMAGVNDLTRSCQAGGDSSSGGLHMDVIDYFTMGTPGNASDFGDLDVSCSSPGSCSSEAGRGVWGGGYIDNSYNRTNRLEYVTIQTTGNGTDFGDLTVSPDDCAGSSDGSRGIIGGGYTGQSDVTIGYITIASTGNASDFGDLTDARHGMSTCSGT